MADMKQKTVSIELPHDLNLILGQTHFIKTVEDLYEAIVGISPMAEFGLAFCEASGPCLVRSDGNREDLIKMAEQYIYDMACGHTFMIILRNVYPINVLPRIKMIPEICHIFCATANPVQVVIAESNQGRGVLGVIDGFMPKAIEKADDKKKRHKFLRDIGYKR